MPPKLQIWTKEAEEMLVEEVKARPILWDTSLDEYRRSDLKDEYWDQVAKILGSPPFTGILAAKRFSNIRDTFFENDKRVTDSKRSGAGAVHVYKPRWSLYYKLEFLRKSGIAAQSVSNLSPLMSEELADLTKEITMNVNYDDKIKTWVLSPQNEENTSNASVTGILPFPPNIPVGPGSDSLEKSTVSSVCSSSTESSSSANSSTQSSKCSTPIPTQKRKAGDQQTNLFEKRGSAKKNTNFDDAVTALKDLASTPLPKQEPSDVFASFVASRLKTLDEEKRKTAENEILQVLLKY